MGGPCNEPTKAMKAVRAALVICGALLGGWLGGNIVFGMLISGTWLFDVLAAVLPPDYVIASATLFLWACRITVFLSIIFMAAERAYPRKRRT